jgi:hypothetical protein
VFLNIFDVVLSRDSSCIFYKTGKQIVNFPAVSDHVKLENFTIAVKLVYYSIPLYLVWSKVRKFVLQLHRLAFGEHFANFQKETSSKLSPKIHMLCRMKQSVHEICGLAGPTLFILHP